jgi:hypothetical protein
MAIIQISSIQQRSGNLVDLPQLAEAQFGWANDAKRLFIGADSPNPIENVEVLTSYSQVSFSQIPGANDNNLNLIDTEDGQILGITVISDQHYVVNKGGLSPTSPGGLVNLGTSSNVKLGGGTTGFVLDSIKDSSAVIFDLIPLLNMPPNVSPELLQFGDERFFYGNLSTYIGATMNIEKLVNCYQCFCGSNGGHGNRTSI